jgi:retinol dehydrogenase 12
MSELPRIDAVVQNADILTQELENFEDSKSSITVNVVSTILLADLLLPTLRRSAEIFETLPKMTMVSSGSHVFVQFPDASARRILGTLNDESTANMTER